MEDPRHIHISDYDYDLPDERIAKYPLARRDESRLLVYHSGAISDRHFTDLPELLEPGSLLFFNNTRVIRARLHFRKTTGADIEIFCLEPEEPKDYALMFQARHTAVWLCLIGHLKRWKSGLLERTVQVGGSPVRLTAELLGPVGTSHAVRFRWDSEEATFADVLEAVGELPIPPYLNRETETSDLTNYQTVYSKVKGSVAAPTAGLHFTPAVLQALSERGIEQHEITLHVGAGTFKPVKSEEISGHEMHAEWISVGREAVERLLAHDATCTAVGTTSVRTLESLYYIGMYIRQHRHTENETFHIPQWMPYDSPADPTHALTSPQALEEILEWMERNHTDTLHASTSIIIVPGYTFHFVKRMVTNFHQPHSTLLLLVSAFVHGDWQRIYRHALDTGYRFLSYGDSSLLIP